MTYEVTLLQWSNQDGGLRVLGRTRDAELVELVRGHLLGELEAGVGGPRQPDLRPIEGGRQTEGEES